jgi:phage shock protein PspC (stress-responsive transcriptional regulator)
MFMVMGQIEMLMVSRVDRKIDGVCVVIGGLLPTCRHSTHMLVLIMHLQGSHWFPVVLAYLCRLQCPQHGRLRKTVKREGTAPVFRLFDDLVFFVGEIKNKSQPHE